MKKIIEQILKGLAVLLLGYIIYSCCIIDRTRSEETYPRSKYHSEGQKDYKRGLSDGANPYRETYERHEWLEGWVYARDNPLHIETYPRSKYYSEGQKDYKRGLSDGANPYHDTIERHEWLEGWVSARDNSPSKPKS